MKWIFKIAVLAVSATLAVSCAKKKDEPRPEFGGQAPENFYYSFRVQATNCNSAEPKLMHQGLFFANHQYFDLENDTDLSIHLYVVGVQYRIEFEKTHYRYGGRDTFFKSRQHDQEQYQRCLGFRR